MTESINVHWTYEIKGTNRQLVHDCAKRVMDELLELEAGNARLGDSAVSLDHAANTLEIEVLAEGDMQDDAAALGRSAIKAAVSRAIIGRAETAEVDIVDIRLSDEAAERLGYLAQP